MSYADKANPTLWGRRLGLQWMPPAVSGSGRGAAEQPDFIVGAEDVRKNVTTNDSTGTPLRAYGISRLAGTSAASTPVYQLDPPIPGVEKTIQFVSTDSAIYVKPATGGFFTGTSLGSSAAAIRSSGGGTVRLVGISTADWAPINVSSSAVNGIAFQPTT